MKKIFTLIVALVATTTMMAQQVPTGTLCFVGSSTCETTVGGYTYKSTSLSDTLKVIVDFENMKSDIVIPKRDLINQDPTSMIQHATFVEDTLLAIPFTGSYAEGFTWKITEQTEFTRQEDGAPVKLYIKALEATYNPSTKIMNLDITYNQSKSLPYNQYVIKDALFYDPTAGIGAISSDETSDSNVHKALVNGKLVIQKDGRQYNAVGAQLK